jgi:hypothetical protein
VWIGLQLLEAALPVGPEPLVHRCEVAPDAIESADHRFAGFRPQGGASGLVTGSNRSDAQHSLDAALVSQMGQPAIAHELRS